MSTTMADGARDRCVAQIGEALFGQPGLTLMELAEKVKASQPSPIGQGDTPWPEIDMILADAYSAGALGLQFEGIARRAAVRAVVAALAARQTVASSQSSGNSGQLDVDGKTAAVKDCLTAGGGQAWVVADGQGARWRMWGSFGPEWTTDRDQALHFARRADAEAFANDDEDAWLIQPAGVPAQAVDLEQFRWAVELARQHHCQGPALNEQVIAECDRLLALIYSKVPTYG